MSDQRYEVTLENGQLCGPYRLKTIVQYAQTGQLPLAATIVVGGQPRTLREVVAWMDQRSKSATEEQSLTYEGALDVDRQHTVIETETGSAPHGTTSSAGRVDVSDISRAGIPTGPIDSVTREHELKPDLGAVANHTFSTESTRDEPTERKTRKHISRHASRPMAVLVATGIALVITVALIGLLRFRNYYTPSNTVVQLIDTLRKADVGRLKVDAPLGAIEATKSSVLSLGKAEFERREELVASIPKIGAARARELSAALSSAALSRMQSLTEEERTALRTVASVEFQEHQGRPPYYWEINKLDAIVHRTLSVQLAPKVLKAEEAKAVGDVVAFLRAESVSPSVAQLLGLNVLSDEQRHDIDQLPKRPVTPEASEENATLKAAREKEYQRQVRAFVESQGTMKLQAQLHEKFANERPTIKDVRFAGELPRSLLRSRRATVELNRHVTDEEYEGPWGKTINLEHHWGKWHVANTNTASANSTSGSDLSADSKDELPPALSHSAALGAVRQVGNVMGPLGLVVLLLGLVFWHVMRNQKQPFGVIEYVVLSISISLLAGQHLIQGQISIDDWFVTPMVVALPCVAGALRGVRTGYLCGTITGCSLLASCVLFQIDQSIVHPDLIPLSELVLVSASLAGLGAISGALIRIPGIVVIVPLVLVIVCGLLQRDVIVSPYIWGHAALASVWTGILVLRFWTRLGPDAEHVVSPKVSP